METKKKVKITVGSVVRVVKAMREGEKQYIGRLGMVVSVIGDVTLDSFFELTAKRRLKVQIDSDFIWLDEDQVQLVTSEKQKIPEPEATAHKFKVGDKVSVCTPRGGWVNGTVLGEYKSCSGLYLIQVPDGYGWSVTMDEAEYYVEDCGTILKVGRRCYWNADKNMIKPLKLTEDYGNCPKRRIVIEITDDGAEAKYIIGKNIEKTASIKRHKDDKPDDRLAAHYVVGKLFGQKVMKDNVDMDALKNAKYDCMIARYHLDGISKVLDPFGEPDFGKVDFKF